MPDGATRSQTARGWRLEHAAVDVDVDLDTRTVAGAVVLTLVRVPGGPAPAALELSVCRDPAALKGG